MVRPSLRRHSSSRFPVPHIHLGTVGWTWSVRAGTALDNSTLAWGTARGPIDVVTLYLQRVGWNLLRSTVAQDDQGMRWSLLQIAPMLLHDLLRAGILRWQMQRVMAHHEQSEPDA
eukprot:2263012-Pyramimonas_sp.AAC.1